MYNGRPSTAQTDSKPPPVPSSSEWARPRKGSYCEYKQQKLNKAIIDAYPVNLNANANKSISGTRTSTQAQPSTHQARNTSNTAELHYGGGYEGRRNSLSFFGQRDGRLGRDIQLGRQFCGRQIGARDISTRQLGRDVGTRQPTKAIGAGLQRYGSIDLGSYSRPNQRPPQIDYIPKQRPQHYDTYQNSQKLRYEATERKDHFHQQSKSFFEHKSDAVPIGSIVPSALRKKVQTGKGCQIRGDEYRDQEQSWTHRQRQRNEVQDAYANRYENPSTYDYKGDRKRQTLQNGPPRLAQQYMIPRQKQSRSPIIDPKPASHSFMRSNNDNISSAENRVENNYLYPRRQMQNLGTFSNGMTERQREIQKYMERERFDKYDDRSNFYREQNRQEAYAGKVDRRFREDESTIQQYSRQQLHREQRTQKTPTRSKTSSELGQVNLSQSRKNLLIQKSKNLQQKMNQLSGSKRLLTSASKDQKQFKFKNGDADKDIESQHERIQRIKNNKDRVYESPFKDKIKSNIEFKAREIESFNRGHDQPLKKSDLNITKQNLGHSIDTYKKSPITVEKQGQRPSQNTFHSQYHPQQQSKGYQASGMKKSVGLQQKSNGGSDGCMNRINALNEKINEKISMLINAYEK